MDLYRNLYKENSLLNPQQHKRNNREIQNANRAQKRKEIFQSTRQFEVSPTPTKINPRENSFVNGAKKPLSENKRNIDTPGICGKELKNVDEDAPNFNKSRIALAACGKANSKKSRQEAFLLRFIEWKESQKQKEEQKKQNPKKQPFVPVGRAPPKTHSKQIASFVPKDHRNFKPPEGLKNPLLQMTTAAGDSFANSRRSLYSIVPTPPKNKTEKIDPKKSSLHNKTQAVSNLARGNCEVRPSCSTTKLTTPLVKAAITNSSKAVRPCTSASSIGKKSTADSVGALKDSTSKTAPLKKPLSDNTKTALNESVKNGPVTIKRNCAHAPQFAKPQAPQFVRPQLSKITRSKVGVIGSSTNLPKTGSGAVGKAHLLQSKRVAEASVRSGNAKLTTNLKAKKSNVSISRGSVASNKFTINGNTLLKVMRPTTTGISDLAETPKDLLINSFEPLVTSTGVKSLSPHSVITLHISPVNVNKVTAIKDPVSQHNSSSAKRALMPNENENKWPPCQIQGKTSKFNFVRYSMGRPEMDMSGIVEQNDLTVEIAEKEIVGAKSTNTIEEATVVEAAHKPLDVQTITAEPIVDDLNTTSSIQAERPANYMSPYVSVSRGKVSARKEQEKRNSIYLPGVDATKTPPTNSTNDVVGCQPVTATPVSIESRRILEAVRYFRQQVNGEILRLHGICDQWEIYKEQHLPLLQQTGGDDMINVTIGQTKLLTSKKFQQFNGLIDRCEAGARGTAPAPDGSENTKPITDVDLEGFWAMLNLQVDNVDKRFENLERWKTNNWEDPGEVQLSKSTKFKAKLNLNKVKKAKPPAKSKTRSALEEMIRKMHTERGKNKASASANCSNVNASVVFTPTRQQQRRSKSVSPKLGGGSEEQRNSTPRHISVVVRDRKSLSAAATVISLPADGAIMAAVAAQKRRLRGSLTRKPFIDDATVAETPKSIVECSNELRRSLNSMEKALGSRNELLRNSRKQLRRSGTPNFVELPIYSELKQQPEAETTVCTPSPPSAITVAIGRKSILKTPGTAKGKPKNVIFNDKLRIKKFKFTLEDEDEELSDEQGRTETNTEESLADQRIYSLRTRKVVLRPSSEFEIP